MGTLGLFAGEDVGDGAGGVGGGGLEGGGFHGGGDVGMEEDGFDFAGEDLIVESAFGEEAGGAGAGEDLGVASLVIFGGVGVGDEEAGDAELSEFSEGGGAGAGDGEIGDAIGEVHAVAEGGDVLGEEGVIGVNIASFLVVGGAGDVEELDTHLLEGGEGGADDAVDAASALGTAHDEEGFQGGIEFEESVGILVRGEGHVGPDGGADGADVGVGGEVGAAGVEAEEDGGGVAGVEFVGFAGDGIGLVDEGLAAFFFAGVEGSERGEATHAEDGGDLMLADEFAAGAVAGPEGAEEADHFRRPRAGHGEGREGGEGEVGVTGGSEGVDFFLADEQEDLMAAGF